MLKRVYNLERFDERITQYTVVKGFTWRGNQYTREQEVDVTTMGMNKWQVRARYEGRWLTPTVQKAKVVLKPGQRTVPGQKLDNPTPEPALKTGSKVVQTPGQKTVSTGSKVPGTTPEAPGRVFLGPDKTQK